MKNISALRRVFLSLSVLLFFSHICNGDEKPGSQRGHGIGDGFRKFGKNIPWGDPTPQEKFIVAAKTCYSTLDKRNPLETEEPPLASPILDPEKGIKRLEGALDTHVRGMLEQSDKDHKARKLQKCLVEAVNNATLQSDYGPLECKREPKIDKKTPQPF